MAWIELKPEGAGPIRAWRADPSGKPKGGIVVIQEIFGAIMAVVILGEPFALYHVLALLLVVGGIAIAQRGAAGAQR